MNFIKKQKLTFGSSTYSSKPYDKPAVCPFCGIGTDAPMSSAASLPYKTSSHIVVASYQCTSCAQKFVVLYERNNDELSYLDIWAHPSGEALPPCFEKISSRFVEVHKEAQAVELMGYTDLASMGYRKALEIIVKDFAINVLGEPEDTVSKKPLADAIGIYLHQDSLMKTADVVRILGNDHVHYQEKYPEFDFSLLEHYYSIFLQLISTQYDIHNPPVERKGN